MTPKRVKADIRGRAMAWLFLVCAMMGCFRATAAAGFIQRNWKMVFPAWGTAQSGISFGDEASLADALARALNGDLDALAIQITVRGEERGFGEREIAHMADVASLYRLARVVLYASGTALLALLLWGWSGRRNANRAGMAKGALLGVMDIVVAAGILSLWAAMDFRSAFWAFHRVAFANDLWLLDPNTDLLMQLMPQAFFEYATLQIVLRWVLCAAAWCACWGFAFRQANRKKAVAA